MPMLSPPILFACISHCFHFAVLLKTFAKKKENIQRQWVNDHLPYLELPFFSSISMLEGSIFRTNQFVGEISEDWVLEASIGGSYDVCPKPANGMLCCTIRSAFQFHGEHLTNRKGVCNWRTDLFAYYVKKEAGYFGTLENVIFTLIQWNVTNEDKRSDVFTANVRIVWIMSG